MALLLMVSLTGCGRIAKIIPGNSEAQNLKDQASSSPTPILVSPSLQALPSSSSAAPDDQLARSIVAVQTLDASTGLDEPFRNGSGVVVDAANRLILTSYAIVMPFRADGSSAYTTIVISPARQPGAPAQPEFEADLVAADPTTDVAVLRVTRDLGSSFLTPGKFDLPAVTLGDARTATAGVPVRLLAYPGLPTEGTQRTETLQVSSGTINGLRGVAGAAGRTWLKIDTSLPYGSAGGGAFNQVGELLGFLAQDRYLPAGGVGQIRPLDLALDAIDSARKATASDRYQAPLHMTGNVPGTTRPLPGDGMWISRPSFGQSAIQTQGTSDLVDYETRFAAGLPALYYEYAIEGVPKGTVVEERWFLDDVLQDALSSSTIWDGRTFALVGDRITVPGAGGLPRGRWRLEIWAAGLLRAQSTALLGVTLHQPQIANFADGSVATPEAYPLVGAVAGVHQLLVFFDFAGMEGVQQLEWLVFHDNQRVYTSPPLRWTYGDSGRFWVGYAPTVPVTSGKWEIELHVDGRVMGVRAIVVP